MSEGKENPAEQPEEQDAPAEEVVEEVQAEADGDAAVEEGSEKTDAERVAELEEELAAMKDQALRAMAEAQNVRRRAEKEKADASKYAIAAFAREMIGVADNLRRALDSIDSETRKSDEAVENLAVGVEMTEKEMIAAFDRVGIKAIDALEKKFDHNFHEALFEIPDESKPAGTVLQVIETGYVLKDRLLRPAKVGVSKGGPKEAPAPVDETADAQAADNKPDQGVKEAYEGKKDTSGSQLDEEL